jgi:hypothetical protein
MPMFDAGAAVEALDWDFTKAGVKATGTIPEPSDRAIGDFLDGLKKLYTETRKMVEAGEQAEASPGEMLEALNAVTGDMFVEQMKGIAVLYAALCSGKPGVDELLALPLRVRAKFYGWVMNEVVNPEAETGAGTAVVKPLRAAAAG